MRQYPVLALLATIALGACGTKGSLRLPPKPVSASVPATADADVAPPSTNPSTNYPAPAADDSSTAGEPAR